MPSRIGDGLRISGLVDFGDMVHGYAVADLAIAAAYMMLDAEDPLDVLSHIVRGAAGVAPLRENELRALFGLSAMRLAMSACIAAHQRRDERLNRRRVSQSLDRLQGRLLHRLGGIFEQLD